MSIMRQQYKQLQRPFPWRLLLSHTTSWWKAQDKHYGWAWRAANIFTVAIVIVSLAMPILNRVAQNNAYKLSAEALSLVGHTDQRLAKQLTYDSSKQSYQFNSAAIKSFDPQAPISTQVGTAGGGKDKSLYALDVPQDISKGVTYHDTNSQLSFSLVPEFKASEGRDVQGHLVYPLSGGTQAIYTLKNNGLKEDIVVPQVSSSTMRFTYHLNLPKTLEVKTIPQSGGAIGIYSADPALFGDISFGSDADQTTVEKARINAPKTYLVFGLPAPVIKAVDDVPIGNASARFELQGDQLTVVAENLGGIKTPVTIDPSVVVTSTTDFQTGGNNDGMIDFSTAGQLTRGGLTGGSTGTWATESNALGSGRRMSGAVAYNGYLYWLGGDAGSNASQNVYYASINGSNGSTGTLTATTSMQASRSFFRAFAYNGYMYAVAGNDSTSTPVSTVEYAPINSDGTLGAWQYTSSLPANRSSYAGAIYNGYIYVMGGNDGTGVKNSVLYAPVNGDGTLGAWHYTHSSTDDGTSFVSGFTTARSAFDGVAYNDYLYIAGGYNGTSTYYNDVQFAHINGNGTIDTWRTANSFTTARAALSITVYNGYIYVMGGTTDLTNSLSDTQYASITGSGNLSSWQSTSTMAAGAYNTGAAAYNGYLFLLGGEANSSTKLATVQYAKIDSAGQTQAFANASNSFTTARSLACSVAYNNYIYVLGGSSDDSNSNVSSVYYSAINTSTGDLGAWSSTNAIPAVTDKSSCVAYNGYLYVLGGESTSNAQVSTVRYVPINSNGTLGTWATTTSLSDTFSYAGSFVYQSKLYVIGGSQATNNNNVWYATISSNGTIGSWTNSTNHKTQGYYASGFARIGKYVYYIGGTTNGTAANAQSYVEYGTIGSNGDISGWASTTALPAARSWAQATAVNGCVYVVGGVDTSAASQSSVYYACPNANGTISSWSTAKSLPLGTTDAATTSYGGYIYDVGGSSSGVVATTKYAKVNDGGTGTPGGWGTTGSNIPSMVGGSTLHSPAVYNSKIYSTGESAASVYAPINADGTIGSWVKTAGTPKNTPYNITLISNGYIYSIGGFCGASGECSASYYAPLDSNGVPGAWSTLTSNIPTERDTSAGVSYNGYLYIIGGDPGERVVEYAKPGPTGNITSWSTGTALPDDRYGTSAVAYDGYIYLVGGGTNSGAPSNTVISAPINTSNGSLGSWTYTSSFHGGVYTSAVAVNGFMYILGGSINTYVDERSVSQMAPINANGTLGDWQMNTSPGSETVGPQDVFAANGYIYALSWDSTGAGNDMFYYAPLNSIARKGHYSKLVDLGALTKVTGITYNYSGLPPFNSASPGPVYYRPAGNDGVFGNPAIAAASLNATGCLVGQGAVRYLLIMITLDDSGNDAAGGAFPDPANPAATVTDFTVGYNMTHPAPNIRLRHGQTLQSGNLSALDTCYP
jgi:N-acetylneuraminic acid mutarotase